MPEPGKVGATTKPTKTDDENNTQEKNSSEKKRQPHYTSMTHKYYLTLRALFKKVENPGPVKGEKNEICERINKLLNETQMNWSNAQEAELLLAEVIDEPTLRVEVCRRLSEVDSLEDGAVKSFYNNHSCKDLRKEVPTEGEEKKTKHLFPEEYLRSLYARLLNDLQWQSNKDLWKKKLANDARTKSGLLFIGVLLTFLSIVSFALHK